MHSTDNLKDGYMGSGRNLRYSINKHGKENHTCEILEFLDSREELKNREKEIVNLNEIHKKDCMNIMVGGYGGHISKPNYYEELTHIGKEAFKEKLKDPEYKKKHSEKLSKAQKKSYNTTDRIKCIPNWSGKSHTEDTKQKMSETKKGQGSGKTNSQHGTYWVTDGTTNKKLKKDDVIPKGWYKGRTKTKEEVENINKVSFTKRKVERPPYEQLVNEIGELGLTGTGRKYGVSLKSIKKWRTHYEKHM